MATVYPDPIAAMEGDDWGGVAIIVALFWSIYVSYRGVRTAFEVRPWAARVWFGILPATIYALALGIIFALFLLTSLLISPPDLDNTRRIEREGFSLNYPGNWEVDVADEDYDPDYSFAIAPPVADAQIRFWFYEYAMDSQGCADQTRDNLEAVYAFSDLTAFDHWGDYDGAGYRGDANIEGGDYEFLMFCATERVRPFEILLAVEGSAADKLRPGFDLIRDSLELRPVAESLELPADGP
jgi:hypothetical protein